MKDVPEYWGSMLSGCMYPSLYHYLSYGVPYSMPAIRAYGYFKCAYCGSKIVEDTLMAPKTLDNCINCGANSWERKE